MEMFGQYLKGEDVEEYYNSSGNVWTIFEGGGCGRVLQFNLLSRIETNE